MSDKRPSGYPCSALCREAHSDAGPGQHVDEGIDAEAMQAPPNEIVHAWLAHAQQLRGLSLRELAARNQLLEGEHEVRPHAEVLGFHTGESEVAEDIC